MLRRAKEEDVREGAEGRTVRGKGGGRDDAPTVTAREREALAVIEKTTWKAETGNRE